MPVYVLRKGQLVLKDRASTDGPMVISDDLGQPLQHHGFSDGRRTESKSTFRRWTKEAGLIEKGNDRNFASRQQGGSIQDVIRDVAEATQQVKAGYRPQIRWRED